MPTPRTRNPAPRSTDLIEESVFLLRRHLPELAGYYLASAPFAVALVYFWAFVTWFAPADGEVAAGAFLLAWLFGVMKAGQNRFALRMLAYRLGETPPTWRGSDWLAEVSAQLREQAAGVVLVPLAAAFGVPFAWIYGHYQTATILPRAKGPGEPERPRRAWKLAQLWPAQSHWALTILGALWLMVFLNLLAAFYVIPQLATQWLGLQTEFALSGWSMLNSTFLALVGICTHLLVDPLIKVYFTLRAFRGRACQTGDDLRLVLRRSRLAGAMPLAIGLMVTAWFAAPPGNAAEAARPSASRAAPARVLDQAFDQVLARPEFRWRLRPLPVPPDREKEGIIKGFVRATFEVIRQVFRTVGRWFEGVRRWVADLWPGGSDSDASGGRPQSATSWLTLLQWTAYLLIVGVAGLLLFVIWKIWSHHRTPADALRATAGPLAPPDLRDENVEASRLPAEGWLELAREQAAAGEWRLALRALFLATLARRAREGLLSLAKFKTNLDYEGELRRRALNRTAVIEDFRHRRRQFEEVWYGAATADDAAVRDWLRMLEGQP